MNKPERTFQVERKNDRQRFKPKPWSHQDELKGLVGKSITLHVAGVPHEVTLLAADAFTLRVRTDKSVMTVFKHAVTAYEVAE